MKKNILANIVGKAWAVLSSFLFVPLYIKYLGFESYSVISFTLIIAGIMVILDSGLTATLLREFARNDNSEKDKIKTYETLQVSFFIITLFCLVLICLFSNIISSNINVKTYSQKDISFFLKIVSVDIGFQLLFRFYMGGLLGLNEQVKANLYQIFWGVVRNGVVIILISLYPSLDYFFIWQAMSTLIFTIIIKYSLDREVYKKNIFVFNVRFDKTNFSRIKRFSGGVFLIYVVSVISTQMDKILISKMVGIETLGYYTLAVAIASSLIIIANPIATAILPEFTALYSVKSIEVARGLFNKYSNYISILVFTFLSNIIFFDRLLIWLWTGNHIVADHTYQFVPIVTSAYAFIVLQTVSYQVAIANGYTKLSNVLGIASLFFIVPGYILMGKYYGGIGIASLFLIIQGMMCFAYIYYINKKFIQENFFKNIFLRQIFFPMLLSFFLAYLFSILIDLIPYYDNRLFYLILIGLSSLITMIILSLFFLPQEEKKDLFYLIRKFRLSKFMS